MTIARLATVLTAACVTFSLSAPSQAGGDSRTVAQGIDATDLSAQQRQVRPYRVRPRIRVYPAPQPPFWEYPRPGTYSWPGPGARRDCRAWYVVENRPSGAVMTPRMRCEWIPG